MLVATLGLLAQMAIVPPADAREDEGAARDARSAQRRFERVRRANLPRSRGGGGFHPCEVRIGRFCYWPDTARTTSDDAEPERIIRARLELLAELDSAAKRKPDDPWIVGQLVRYHLEAKDYDGALRVTRSCRAEPWWCASLAGLTHHVSMEYAAADSAFAVALAGMPDTQRCEWLDLRMIADRRWSRAFRDAGCDARERLANRAFLLGQPLWMVPGRDLRTEHFARRTMALVLARSATGHGNTFGNDNRELVLRYGWPVEFTREEPGPGALGEISVTGHDREPAYYFFPDVPNLQSARPDAGDWRLREWPAPTRYAPRHVRRMTPLPHQLARFARGDSMLVVAAFNISDAALARDQVTSALAVMHRDTVRVVARAADQPIAGLVPSDTMIASVEVLGDSTKHAARARYTVAPLACAEWCLSDILVIDPTKVDSAADALEAATAAYPELRLPASAPVGVFFEIAPAMAASSAPPRPANFSLSVVPVRVSIARRVAASLRLADRPEAVRLRWQGVVGAPGDGPGQIIALRIPPSSRGRYQIQLTVTPRNGASVHASREIELVR